jgi:hypothetical protein
LTPFIPQVFNNVTRFNVLTPILPVSVGSLNQDFGVACMKYTTSYIPGQDPGICYSNPFHGDEPLGGGVQWYFHNPLKGTATAAIHAFNLLDQDLPFPYNTNLAPPYYPAASLANWFVVACGFLGILLGFHSAWRQGLEAMAVYIILAGTVVTHIGMHAFFSVETRFGVPSLMILYIFAAWLVWRRVLVGGKMQRLVLLSTAAAITAGAYPISYWVRLHSQAIRAATEVRNSDRKPASMIGRIVPVPAKGVDTEIHNWDQEAISMIKRIVPGKIFTSGTLSQWRFTHSGASNDNTAILFVPADAIFSMMEHRVVLAKSADYLLEFEARAATPTEMALRVGLYAPGYDRGAQDTVFTSLSTTFQHYQTRWNTGPDAPQRAWIRFIAAAPCQVAQTKCPDVPQGAGLRLINSNTAPLEVRNIVFKPAK